MIILVVHHRWRLPSKCKETLRHPPNLPHARALAYYDNIICQVNVFLVFLFPLPLRPLSAWTPSLTFGKGGGAQCTERWECFLCWKGLLSDRSVVTEATVCYHSNRVTRKRRKKLAFFCCERRFRCSTLWLTWVCQPLSDRPSICPVVSLDERIV